MASSSTSQTTYAANEKRRPTRYHFSRDQIILRPRFPGHRPRYFSFAGVHDTLALYQHCADLWPEYFSQTAATPYSYSLKPLKTSGLLGIAFKHPDIDDMVEICPFHGADLQELVRVVGNAPDDYVEKMWKEYRISAPGLKYFDIRLVREGRDRLRVAGEAHARLSRHMRPRVIGGEMEKEGKAKERKRGREETEEDEEAEERPRQRRRL